jgi:cystathionine beta-lyase/cystathionine gamma-synthase
MDKSTSSELQAETLAVQGGEDLHPCRSFQTPIFQTANFRFESIDDLKNHAEGRARQFLYTRHSNPTLEVAEKKAALLENGEAGLVFASGMAALTSAVLALVERGERILATTSLYGGTLRLLHEVMPRLGVEVDFFDGDDCLSAIRRRQPGTRLLLAETPTNPGLRLIPLAEVAAAARQAGIVSLMDNTFATPVNQKPLDSGWDLVAHSATKYLGGHADVTAGLLVGSAELLDRVEPIRRLLGGVLDPSAAYLLIRGMKTLHVRVERQNSNALELACRLQSHPRVEAVLYPWLPSHPQFTLAKAQMAGGGGVLSFYVKGGWEAARRFFNALRRIPISTSLGNVDSLVTSPFLTSHYGLDPEETKRLLVTENMVRFSVGIEGVEDLWEDLRQALECSQQP